MTARPAASVSSSAVIAAARAALDVLAERAGVIESIGDRVAATFARGGKLLTCGNGGSAAEALHLAEELVGRYAARRAPLAAVCLNGDPTALTCIANDFGFEEVFARQVEGLGARGDALLVLSTSGRSANIVRALERARARGVTTLGLLGPPGSPAEPLCDAALTLPLDNPARIQELHLVVIHALLERLEAKPPAG
jgi:D-sedoheptulose 7-phosphate isomerase